MVQLPPSTAVAERDAVTAFVWLRTRNDLPAALAGATLHPRPGFGQDRPSSPSTQHRSTIPVRRGVRAGDSTPHVRGPPPAGGAGPPQPEPPAAAPCWQQPSRPVLRLVWRPGRSQQDASHRWCATDVERLRPGLGSLLESLIGRLAVQAAVWPVIVVEVLPLAQLVVEELGVVDHHPVQQAVELLDIDAMGALDLAVESRGAGLDVDMADALSSTCQWKLAPNSTPLSVWMTSTRNGSRSST